MFLCASRFSGGAGAVARGRLQAASGHALGDDKAGWLGADASGGGYVRLSSRMGLGCASDSEAAGVGRPRPHLRNHHRVASAASWRAVIIRRVPGD